MVLEQIIVDAALQYRPDAAKYQDIAYHAEQTAVFINLLRIYRQLDDSTASADREALRDTIEQLQQILYPWITTPEFGEPGYGSFFDLLDSYDKDSGIVVTIGKNGGFRWGVHQLAQLRGVLKTNLPIEIFYAGDNDLPIHYRQFLEDIQAEYPNTGNITIIDINERFPDPDKVLGLPGGWAMRPYAMLASSFRKAMLIDADTVFLQDPRLLLDEPNFREHGSVFWHDRVQGPGRDDHYEYTVELLDLAKARHLDKVKTTLDGEWFNRHTGDEQERYTPPLNMLITVEWY